jgi:signal transduction histidine kinase
MRVPGLPVFRRRSPPRGPGTRGELPAVGVTTAAVPPSVQHAAYRIVQEALTNIRKHAPGAQTRVLVSRCGEDLVVEVRNGPGSAGPRCRPAGTVCPDFESVPCT